MSTTKEKPPGYVFGSPTKYRAEFCEEIVKFFDKEPYEPVLKSNGEPLLNKFGDPVFIPCKLPTLERFAFDIGVSVQTLHNWTKTYDDFFDAFMRAKNIQKDILMQNGLARHYDAGFAKFVAINNTDMVDKVETKHSGSIAAPVIKDDIGNE